MSINRFSLIGLLLFCNVLLLTAQVGSKYLAGGVPLVDGKVLFTREIKVNSVVSTSQLYDLVNSWMFEQYGEREGSIQRILVTDKEQGYVVAQGDDKLVFKSMLLMLDQADMIYQIVARIEKGKCTLEVRHLKYGYQDYKEIVPAEEMITDKVALHKSGEKLNRNYDKFRTFTIDRIDQLEASLTNHLGEVSIEDVVKEVKPASIVDVEAAPQVVIPSESMAGYKQMNADQISESIIKMFKDSRAVVAIGKDLDTQILTAAWSGTGNFGGKPVAMTFVNTESDTSKEQVYTISFYTEIHGDALDKMAASKIADRSKVAGLTPITTLSGAVAFGEAWMVIECKKVTEQDSSQSALNENAQSKKWTNNQNVKLLMGEIVNIWVR